MRTRSRVSTQLIAAAAIVVAAAACGDEPKVTEVPTPPDAVAPKPAGDILNENGITVLDMGQADILGPNAQTAGAIFTQSAFETSSGTGGINPFLKTSSSADAYNAFNTSGDKPSTVSNNSFTRDLPLSWVPTVSIGGAAYREFRLDIDEPNNADDADRLLSVDRFELWVSPVGEIDTDANNLPNFGASGATKRYEFPAQTYMRTDGSLSSGNGGGDVFFYIPETAFGADGAACPYDGGVTETGCGRYVYVVIRLGDQHKNDGGFEEFAVRKLPYVTKTAEYKFDETVTWTITKRVSKTNSNFVGQSVTFDLWNGTNANAWYQVSVDKTVTPSNTRVEGDITITNPTDGNFTVQSLIDSYDGSSVNVVCPSQTVLAKSTLVCHYVLPIPAAPVNPPKLNTATATLTNGTLTLVVQGTKVVPTQGVKGTTTGAASVNVDDTIDGATNTIASGVTDDQTFTTYSRNFACADDVGTTPNTARVLNAAGGAVLDTDAASVTVNCYDLQVAKTTDEARGTTFNWDMTKSVNPTARTIYTGDQSEHQYTVGYTKTVGTQTFNVTGNITVTNPASSSGDVVVLALPTDVVSPGAIAGSVVCAGVAFPKTLAPNQSFACTYSATLPNADTRTNTAGVTGRIPTNNDKAFTGTAEVNFTGVVASTINNSVEITDPNDPGSPRTVSATGSFTYEKTFECPSGAHPNTATMTGTGINIQRSASVTITCVSPTVTKTALTSYRRTWAWDILKTRGLISTNPDVPAPASLTLQAGQSYVYPFNVNIKTTGTTNDLAEAHGGITVTGQAAVLLARAFNVTDDLSGITPDPVPDCSAATMTGTGPITCTWSKTLGSDIADRTNVATATLQNIKYLHGGGSSVLVGTTTPFSSSSVNVDFKDPPDASVTLRDNCVTLADVAQHKDGLGAALGSPINTAINGGGQVCVQFPAGTADQTFSYTVTVGPINEIPGAAACGNYRFDNTVTFTTNTQNLSESSSLETPISVECPQACTLTQGYWKTHNGSFGLAKGKNTERRGPPIHDWSANTAWAGWDLWKFFTGTPTPVPTGSTAVPDPVDGSPSWFTNFNTPPQGNVYYQASHQFMAAALNVANGAPLSPIDALLGAAYEFFKANTNPKANFSSTELANLATWASTFAQYNEGKLETLHCSEDGTSSRDP